MRPRVCFVYRRLDTTKTAHERANIVSFADVLLWCCGSTICDAGIVRVRAMFARYLVCISSYRMDVPEPFTVSCCASMSPTLTPSLSLCANAREPQNSFRLMPLLLMAAVFWLLRAAVCHSSQANVENARQNATQHRNYMGITLSNGLRLCHLATRLTNHVHECIRVFSVCVLRYENYRDGELVASP